MTIYSKTNYRKIYESHFGPIPKEENGRTYEIHHIDGKRSNNSPENLRALSIQEHYDIHFSQGDWGACARMGPRMKIPTEEISRLATLANLKRVADGTNPFLSKENARERNRIRVENGTHHFLDSKKQRDNAMKRVVDGTHHFLGGELQRINTRKMFNKGTHPFLGPENNQSRIAAGTHNFLNPSPWKCDHCGKEGKGAGTYARYHGIKCKSISGSRQ